MYFEGYKMIHEINYTINELSLQNLHTIATICSYYIINEKHRLK